MFKILNQSYGRKEQSLRKQTHEDCDKISKKSLVTLRRDKTSTTHTELESKE